MPIQGSPPTARRVLLASNNPHKLAEYRAMLRNSGWEIVAPAEVGLDIDVPEDGATFRENARTKALSYSTLTQLAVIADDSGLEVDSLGGLPGIRSRRFAGVDSDAARIALLLGRMRAADSPSRAARFRCALAVAREGAIIFEAERACEGSVTGAPRGAHGFGYDPVFIPLGYARTFGELEGREKNRISHRGLAVSELLKFLRALGE